MSNTAQLKIGIIISYIAIGINILTGLLYTPWMINSIGKENFGLYTLSLSVISLFVFDFGLSSSVTRFISKYLAEGRQDKANQCYGLVYRLYFLLDVILFLILLSVFFFIPYIYIELTPDEIEKFKVVYCITSFYSILSFPFIPVNGILIAHEKVIQLKLCEVAHKLIIVGAMSICLFLGFGLYALVLINAIAGIISIILKLFCVNKYTKQGINWRYFNLKEFKEIINYSGWVTIISLAQRCIFNIAPSILGILSGSKAIAILGIAITMEGYAYTFANAMNGVFLPKVSRIIYQGDGNVLPLMIRVARLQILAIGFVISGIICFGENFIQLWVGNSFKESYICTVLIVIPILFQLPQEIGLQAIYAKKILKPLAKVFIYMAIANIIISFILAKPLGATGIAISVFFAYMLRTIGMDLILYKDLKINILEFFRNTYLSMFLSFILCLCFGYIISTIYLLGGWLDFIIKGTCFTILYFIIMYNLAMNKYEREIIISPIKRLLKI